MENYRIKILRGENKDMILFKELPEGTFFKLDKDIYIKSYNIGSSSYLKETFGYAQKILNITKYKLIYGNIEKIEFKKEIKLIYFQKIIEEHFLKFKDIPLGSFFQLNFKNYRKTTEEYFAEHVIITFTSLIAKNICSIKEDDTMHLYNINLIELKEEGPCF
jgi:hypothetical protein